MADEPDDALPYLPAAEPATPPALPVSPPPPPPVSTPASSPAEPTPAAPAAASPGPAADTDAQPLTPVEMAVRNVPTVRPAINYGLPAAPPATHSNQPEFVRPELVSMGNSSTAMLIGRGLMVVAALLIGIAARRSTGAGGAERADAFWPVVISAGVFVTVAIAGLVFWTIELADNARRLKVRDATPRRMGWAWAIPLAWVVVSAVTYLQVEVDGELDPLPGVAGVGFAIALAIPYARLQGIYRGLTRRPPVLWLSAFPLDLLAFGLIWWRLTSWPEPVAGSDWNDVRLTANIMFGAAAALALNGLVFGWLAQRGANGVYERLGRLEARSQPDDGAPGPEWFLSGLRAPPAATHVDLRPLISTKALTGVVALFHVLWGLSTVAFGIALVRLAFDYSNRPGFFGEALDFEGEDADRVAIVASTVLIVYVVTIIVHGIWSVLVALNARRVTVHAPNPGTFGIIFTPMPILVVAGLLIGGTVGYWVVLAGLATAFFALLLVNRMLMTLSGTLGGALTGFSTWTYLVTLVYLVGFAESFLFSRAAFRIGFTATATIMQGALIMIGGVLGFRAMQALEVTLQNHRQTRRADNA